MPLVQNFIFLPGSVTRAWIWESRNHGILSATTVRDPKRWSGCTICMTRLEMTTSSFYKMEIPTAFSSSLVCILLYVDVFLAGSALVLILWTRYTQIGQNDHIRTHEYERKWGFESKRPNDKTFCKWSLRFVVSSTLKRMKTLARMRWCARHELCYVFVWRVVRACMCMAFLLVQYAQKAHSLVLGAFLFVFCVFFLVTCKAFENLSRPKNIASVLKNAKGMCDLRTLCIVSRYLLVDIFYL